MEGYKRELVISKNHKKRYYLVYENAADIFIEDHYAGQCGPDLAESFSNEIIVGGWIKQCWPESTAKTAI